MIRPEPSIIDPDTVTFLIQFAQCLYFLEAFLTELHPVHALGKATNIDSHDDTILIHIRHFALQDVSI